MVVSSKLNRSVDDLNLPYPTKEFVPERRARSNSPVKNRRPLLPPPEVYSSSSIDNYFDMKLPSIPLASSHEDLNSISTTSSFSHEQLKSLSNSPVSKRLHINNNSENGYVIPIPFTLQLPPKLSPKNQKSRANSPQNSSPSSPLRHKHNTNFISPSSTPTKQVRLVYTGKNYEKLDLSGSEDENTEKDQFPPLSKSTKPPPVTKNKSKAARLTFQTKLMSQDELSIIEEASISGSSRNSSVKSTNKEKSLPPEPKDANKSMRRKPSRKPPPFPLDDGIKINNNNNNNIVKNNHAPSSPSQFHLSNEQHKKQHEQQFSLTQPAPSTNSNKSPSFSNAKSVKVLPTPSLDIVPPRNGHSHTMLLNDLSNYSKVPASSPNANVVSGSIMPRSKTDENLKLMQHSNAPIMNKDNILKIHKRTFSDESHVSSVSSFSLVGDFMNPSKNPSIRSRDMTSPKVRFDDKSNFKQQQIQQHQQLLSQQSHQFEPQHSHQIYDQQQLHHHQHQEQHHHQHHHQGALVSTAPITSTNESKENQLLTRNLSKASSKSLLSASTEGSWNSLQKSIDISIEDSLNSPATVDFELTKSEPKDLPPLPNPSVHGEISGTLPLRISRSVSPEKQGRIPDVDDTEKEQYENFLPLIPGKDSASSGDSDNEGAGKRFSFPNSGENITNSEKIRQRIGSDNSHRSKFSHITRSSGQIEIPDLSTKSIADSHTTRKSFCSYNGTTFDDMISEVNSADTADTSVSNGSKNSKEKLEPIGIPTRASQQIIKEQFRVMHNDEDSDTDIESIYKYNTKSSKSQPNLTLKNLMNNSRKITIPSKNDELADPTRMIPLTQPSKDIQINDNKSDQVLQKKSSSPVRHRRNKSMYGIDFSHNDLSVSPERRHTRSKSTDLATSSKKVVSEIPANKDIASKRTTQPPITSMNIVIAEPPKQVDYAVDFKESSYGEEFPRNLSGNPTVNEIYASRNASKPTNDKDMNLLHHNLRNLSFNNSDNNRQTDNRGKRVSSTLSKSSFKSSRSFAKSDVSVSDSITIDLTEDDFDVCMVKRSDSSLSYKSVTEKTKDGKEVEVVIVEEDEGSLRDDLSSIYSKYRNDWISRSNSTLSTGSSCSYASAASFESGVSSEAQLQLKSRPATTEIYKQMQLLRGAGKVVDQPPNSMSRGSTSSNSSTNSASYNSRRIQPPSASLSKKTPVSMAMSKSQPNLAMADLNQNDSNYFDYSNGDSYDFNTFMKQRTVSKPA